MATEKNAAAPTPDEMHSATQKTHTKVKVDVHPTLMPPSASKGGISTGLVTGQKVVGTYSTANGMNTWLNITGVGFRKITTANANAHLALAIIGCEACEKQSLINYSLDANNMIQEIYLW
jgi:hypothetical protein